MLAGQQVLAGLGVSTIMAEMDFETYSEAGYYFNEAKNKWTSIPGVRSGKKGLPIVGAAVYSEHPSTEIQYLSYNLKDGRGPQRWHPWDAPPEDLFAHILAGGLIEAHNNSFEWLIWNNVCSKRMGWPPLPWWQLRDSAAKALKWSLPEKLEEACDAIGSPPKDKEGTKTMMKLMCPRQPTKKDPRRRFHYTDPDQAEDFKKLYAYGDQDIVAESGLSMRCPDLSQFELDVWLTDQAINVRGVYIDMPLVNAAIAMFERVEAIYNAELFTLTGGLVPEASKDKALKSWLTCQGLVIESLDKEHIPLLLNLPYLTPHCRRALEIRSILSQSNVKKLYALRNQVGSDQRMHFIHRYCGAERTGRWAGRGVQPQNLSAGGPPVVKCSFGHVHHAGLTECPECWEPGGKKCDWGAEGMKSLIPYIMSGDHGKTNYYWGDPVSAISGIVRGCFMAAPGKELICSDYTAIEAVVAAAIAGEQWRMDVFATHGMIYEMSASKISGVPFEEFVRYKAENNEHHPLRKKLGKISELASAYGGGVGAWRNFGADEFFDTEDELRAAIKAWRADSPNIVKMWQGLEDCAIAAILNPGSSHTYVGFTYAVHDEVLYCRVLSGELMAYHKPWLSQVDWYGKTKLQINFWGYNRDPKKGPRGWHERKTYGGSLFENIVQKLARDLLAFALINLERNGYPVVMHVHDEVISEVDEGTGDIKVFEQIMSVVPTWAQGWPVKAQGGWIGKRYRKE